MARRLLTIGLLLTAAAWCGRAAAKPPDLPLDNKDTLTPQDPLAPVEAAQTSQPNPFPQAVETAAPEMETSLFSQIRPSARRMMASCLLFGVHPLMMLTPPDYIDVDEEEDTNRRVVELLNQSENLEQIADEWERFWMDHGDSATDDAETPAQPEQLHVMPQELPSDDSAQSICPWMRQQQCGSPHTNPQADFDNAPDVLHNLQMLQQARSLIQKAAELGASGRDGQATAVLEQARDLCPGSRIDEAVHQAAAFLFVPFYCGSPSYDFGADEESEPPARTGETEREIEQKLAVPVTVNFYDTPLREVIDELREWQDIDICVDHAALDAQEVSLDQLVSLHVNDISLRNTMNLILKQAHLTYVVNNDVLEITTERAARGKLQRVCYAVAGLLQGDLHCPGTADEPKASSEEALMKLITRTICPQEWSEKGGPCSMDFHPLTRSLVVNATADMQEQIADLLESLQRLHQADEEEEHRRADPHDSCKVLLQKCHAAMDAGRPQEAADLAARAYEIDPEQAAADPFVYKMHLAGDDQEPVDITPCLPPVDPDTPAALEQLYRESLRPPTGAAEEQEPPTAETHPVMFEVGFGLDGSVQMFGQLQRGGPIWHAFLNRFGLAVWSSPDGGADPAPATQIPMDSDSDY